MYKVHIFQSNVSHKKHVKIFCRVCGNPENQHSPFGLLVAKSRAKLALSGMTGGKNIIATKDKCISFKSTGQGTGIM